MFARSLMIQSCFNAEGMQNLGFLFGLDPLLRRVYGDGPEYREAALRHAEYFNTQPYAAGLVLGAVGAMEERRASLPEPERPGADERIRRMKAALGSSLAAMGDSIFWGALRPATAAWTLLAWLLLWSLRVPYAALWGALFCVAAYNAPALWLRWRGLRVGYEAGADVAGWVASLRWERRAVLLRRSGLAAAALLALASVLVPPLGGYLRWNNVFLLAAALGLAAFGVPVGRIYAGACAAGLALAWAGP